MITKINIGISMYILAMYFLIFNAIGSLNQQMTGLNLSLDKHIAHLRTLQGEDIPNPDFLNRQTLLQNTGAEVAALYIGCPSREQAVAAGVKARQISIDELLSIFQSAYEKATLQEQNMSPRSFIVKDTFRDFVERELSASAEQ